MPTEEDFRRELNQVLYHAFRQNRPTVDVNAGELHRRVGVRICAE
jgi:hypothetical protein